MGYIMIIARKPNHEYLLKIIPKKCLDITVLGRF